MLDWDPQSRGRFGFSVGTALSLTVTPRLGVGTGPWEGQASLSSPCQPEDTGEPKHTGEEKHPTSEQRHHKPYKQGQRSKTIDFADDQRRNGDSYAKDDDCESKFPDVTHRRSLSVQSRKQCHFGCGKCQPNLRAARQYLNRLVNQPKGESPGNPGTFDHLTHMNQLMMPLRAPNIASAKSTTEQQRCIGRHCLVEGQRPSGAIHWPWSAWW